MVVSRTWVTRRFLKVCVADVVGSGFYLPIKWRWGSEAFVWFLF